MPTFCLLLTLSTLSLGFAILFKQHHYQRANSDEHVWFYYSVYSYVSYNEVIDEKYCEFLDGGKLALPLTTEETTALFDGVVPVVQIRMEDGYQQQDRRFYIGAYKENMTSDWVMRDGSAVTHFDWGSNQPNNAGLCTLIRLSTSYQPEYWSDTSCDVLRGFICQITITNYHSTSQSSGSELKCGSNFCPSTGTEKKARSKVRCSWLCHQDSSGADPVVQTRVEDGDEKEDRYFYIGAYRENISSNWMTNDGAAVTHFDWNPGQPINNYKDFCMIIVSQLHYRPYCWHDSPCNRLVGFICQITITKYHGTSQSSGSELKCGSNFCPSTGTERKTRSKIRCSWLCHQDLSCSGVKFNQNTGKCLLAVDGSEFNTGATQDAQTVCCFKA